MPVAWAGILCWQVVRKAGIFLLPPPHTHILHLPLCFISNLSCLFKLSACLERVSVVLSPCCVGKPTPQGWMSPGHGTWEAVCVVTLLVAIHCLGKVTTAAVGCGDAGWCSAAPDWALKHCGDPGCRTAPLLHSKTLRGCQDARCFVAPFLRQNISEKVCMEGRIFSPFFRHHPGWESRQGMMAFLHHHSVTKPILLGIGVCQQLSSWCSSVAVPAVAP